LAQDAGKYANTLMGAFMGGDPLLPATQKATGKKQTGNEVAADIELNAEERAILDAVQNEGREVDWDMVEEIYPTVDIDKLKSMIGE